MKLTGLNFSKTAVSLDKVTEIKEFLNEHYEIKVNEFDPNKSVVRSKSKIYLNAYLFVNITDEIFYSTR